MNFVDPYGLYWLQDLSDFFARFGDTITLGGTAWIRQHMGTDDVVNKCSDFYTGRKWAGYAWEVAFAVGGIAKTGVRTFAHGGTRWHIGLELPGKRNLIQLGNEPQFGGIHLAIGNVGNESMVTCVSYQTVAMVLYNSQMSFRGKYYVSKN